MTVVARMVRSARPSPLRDVVIRRSAKRLAQRRSPTTAATALVFRRGEETSHEQIREVLSLCDFYRSDGVCRTAAR